MLAPSHGMCSTPANPALGACVSGYRSAPRAGSQQCAPLVGMVPSSAFSGCGQPTCGLPTCGDHGKARRHCLYADRTGVCASAHPQSL